MTTLLKPPAVPGDAQVGVVSLASTPQPQRVERGMAALRALGYEPQAGKHILVRGPLYFAGTAAMRLNDLHHAFADDRLRAIFSTRGGYGSNYLLEGLDLDLIAEGAKPLIGSSDLTALQLWLLDQLQLPAFYGPMLSADFAREDGIQSGPVCALTWVEPCWSFDVHRNRETKQLDLVQRSRKCLFVYQYWQHPELGWMNARIQTWFRFSIQIC